MLGVPVKPTIKEVDGSKRVVQTLQRAKLWEVQTPQVRWRGPGGGLELGHRPWARAKKRGGETNRGALRPDVLITIAGGLQGGLRVMRRVRNGHQSWQAYSSRAGLGICTAGGMH